MIHLLVKRINNLFNVKLYYNNIEIGNSISATLNNKKSMIHNININRNFQGSGYGKYLLNSTENILLLDNNKLNSINLVAYEKDTIGNNLLDFYKKNDYILVERECCIYDDGENIYNLHKMTKFF